MAMFKRKSDNKEVDVTWHQDGYQITELTQVKTLSELLREHDPIDAVGKSWVRE